MIEHDVLRPSGLDAVGPGKPHDVQRTASPDAHRTASRKFNDAQGGVLISSEGQDSGGASA